MATIEIIDSHEDGDFLHAAELLNLVRAAHGAGVVDSSVQVTVTGTDRDITFPAFDAYVPNGSGGLTFIAFAGATKTVSLGNADDPFTGIAVLDASGNLDIREGPATEEVGDVEEAPVPDLEADEILILKFRMDAGAAVLPVANVEGRAIYVGSATTFIDLEEQFKGADGADLALSETAGDFFRNIGTNQWLIDGEATNETEVSVGWASFVLPAGYIAGGAISIVISAMVILAGDAANNAASTIDVEVYKQSKVNGTVGADICATAAQALATAGADYSFTVTPTGLAAGDKLVVKLTTSVVETAGGTGAANSRIARFGANIATRG
jgi:hypothetical protein